MDITMDEIQSVEKGVPLLGSKLPSGDHDRDHARRLSESCDDDERQSPVPNVGMMLADGEAFPPAPAVDDVIDTHAIRVTSPTVPQQIGTRSGVTGFDVSHTSAGSYDPIQERELNLPFLTSTQYVDRPKVMLSRLPSPTDLMSFIEDNEVQLKRRTYITERKPRILSPVIRYDDRHEETIRVPSSLYRKGSSAIAASAVYFPEDHDAELVSSGKKRVEPEILRNNTVSFQLDNLKESRSNLSKIRRLPSYGKEAEYLSRMRDDIKERQAEADRLEKEMREKRTIALFQDEHTPSSNEEDFMNVLASDSSPALRSVLKTRSSTPKIEVSCNATAGSSPHFSDFHEEFLIVPETSSSSRSGSRRSSRRVSPNLSAIEPIKKSQCSSGASNVIKSRKKKSHRSRSNSSS